MGGSQAHMHEVISDLEGNSNRALLEDFSHHSFSAAAAIVAAWRKELRWTVVTHPKVFFTRIGT